MRKLPASVSTLLIILLGIVLAIAIILGKPQTESIDIDPKSQPLVEVIKAKPSNQKLSINSQASVAAKQRIQLNARVAGSIEKVSQQFIVGALIAKGELLVTLDDIEYRNALGQAKLTLAQAQNQLANELALAREAEGRWKDLGNPSANDFFLRKPQLEAANAQLEAAQLGVELAQKNLNRTKITAPFSGRIAAVNANLGQFVTQGVSIAEIYSTETLQLLVPVSKQQLSALGIENYQINPTIVATIRDKNSGNDVTWQGNIIAINGDIDVNTRLFNMVVEVDNSQQPYLLPGLFVDVELTLPEALNILTLPIKSLVESDFVYVVEQNQLVKKPIRLLSKQGQQIQVSGIDKNEMVVISRPLWTVEGSAVEAKIK